MSALTEQGDKLFEETNKNVELQDRTKTEQ